MQDFKDLKVWQKAHEVSLNVYHVTATFPSEERFGLVSQLRRAAVSVPTNIAEGSKRRGALDYARFLNIAEGSAAEVEYLLMLSRDLGHLSPTTAHSILDQIAELSRMLCGLRARVQRAS